MTPRETKLLEMYLATFSKDETIAPFNVTVQNFQDDAPELGQAVTVQFKQKEGYENVFVCNKLVRNLPGFATIHLYVQNGFPCLYFI